MLQALDQTLDKAQVSQVSSQLSSADDDESYTVDKVLATIYYSFEDPVAAQTKQPICSVKSVIITQSDVRPMLDGTPRDLDRVIFERLAALDAQRFRMAVTDAEVDRALAHVQKQRNISQEQLFALFAKMGLTKEQVREELRASQLIDMVIGYRIKNKVFVSKKEAECYYTSNSVYILRQAFVPFKSTSLRSLQKVKLQQALDSREVIKTAEWSPLLELKQEDIAQDKAFIHELAPDSLSIIQQTDAGATLLWFLGKKPFDQELEHMITLKLQNNKIENALEEYKKELLNAAVIKYTKKQISTS